MRLIRQLLSALLGRRRSSPPPCWVPRLRPRRTTPPSPPARLPAPPWRRRRSRSRSRSTRTRWRSGSQILVNDAAGSNWADGAVEIVDNVASQKLKPGAPAGAFTVAWRVVSSDWPPDRGHLHLHRHGGGSRLDGGRRGPHDGNRPAGHHAGRRPRRRRGSEPFPWSIVIFVGTAVGILVALALMAKRRLTPGDDGRTPARAPRSNAATAAPIRSA